MGFRTFFRKEGNKVVILERLDTQLISQVLQKSVSPFIIRLDKQDANGFVREWATVSMPPQRHLAYALQWFVMALVVLIIFVALNLKKNEKQISKHYILLLLVLIFATPGIAALMFYKHPSWLGTAKINKGTLLNPLWH